VAGTFRPDGGRIELAGRQITRWGEHRRARLLGRVFQNPFSGTAPGMTIAENLSMAADRGRRRSLIPALGAHRRREIRERVKFLGVGLEDRLDNPIGTLSGGQRQALTLLMATWNRPELLLLDEHTAALDPRTADQVIELTRRIVAEQKLMTLMVTHSMQQAVNLGDRLIMMNQGEIIFDVSGTDKRHLTVEDLLDRFNDIRRIEQLDAGAADMLRDQYV
jgi:putative ABC transport system ATP-binding protein